MFVDCGQETQRGLDLKCAGRWLGWLNQGAYPEAKVILTQQVFTCTCVLVIFHRLYLNYVHSHGISSFVCTNLRLSVDRCNEAAELGSTRNRGLCGFAYCSRVCAGSPSSVSEVLPGNRYRKACKP